MDKTNPTSCPHCGGDNGFHTKEIVDFKQFYSWDGSFLEGQHTNGIRGGKAVECFPAANAIGMLPLKQ